MEHQLNYVMLSGKIHSLHPMRQISLKCTPEKSLYQFDNKIYKGMGASPAIEKLVTSFCPGCRLYRQRKNTTTAGGITWTFCCNYYPMLPSTSADNFVIGKFTKVGAVNKNVKGRRGMKKEDRNTSFKCMVNSKMKSK